MHRSQMVVPRAAWLLSLGLFSLGCSSPGESATATDAVTAQPTAEPSSNPAAPSSSVVPVTQGPSATLNTTPAAPSASAPANGGTQSASPTDLTSLRSASCAGWKSEPEAGPTVLELVVDVSRSMTLAPANSTLTKWAVTRAALEGAIASLPANAAVGIKFFPAIQMKGINLTGKPRPVSDCIDSSFDVAVGLLGGPNSAQRRAIAQGFARVEGQGRIVGGTPTHDAYLLGLDALKASTLTGDRHMVLITDGQPTYSQGCQGTGAAEDAVDPSPILDSVALAESSGVSTFVIGSPGSEQGARTGEDARPWLSVAAERGGTATPGCSDAGPNFCHFDMSVESDFAQGLKQALANITKKVISCTYPLPTPKSGESLDPAAVNVVLTRTDGSMALLLKNDQPDCTEGWYYAGGGKEVRLCAASCEAANADAGANLELFFGCASIVSPLQ